MTKRKPTPNPTPITPNPFPVSLVGAGPGDPGLITVAGLDRIKEADVIVYDRLAAPALLTYAKPDAELIYVGKTPYADDLSDPANTYHLTPNTSPDTSSQSAINQLLIEKAREGNRVVRLKGGDPFVFGRGGEEAEALHDAGIPFEIIPGVTSAVAVPAYAGIPVTHRGLASSFAVITGHDAEDSQSSDPTNTYHLTPNTYPTSPDTLVFLMGVKSLPDIIASLIANGRSSDTPAAVIRWGTTPEQQTITGTLADIVQRVEDEGITAPAITVVGEVVRLREKLSWFEDRPLFGDRVLITRTRKQASTLARLLAAEGAIPIELPAIEIEPTYDPAAVVAALESLTAGRYSWAVFTSANAVDLWFTLMHDRHLDARAFGPTKIAAIGPATSAALATHGITADVVPAEYIAESLAAVILSAETSAKQQAAPPRRNLGAEGKGPALATRILLPRAQDARPELPDALRAAGAEVNELTLYRAAIPAQAPAEALALLRDGKIDIVAFTSSSTVRNLAAILNGDMDSLRKPFIVCIGPITAATVEEVLGHEPDAVAKEHTVEGLVAALLDYDLMSREGIKFLNRQMAEADELYKQRQERRAQRRAEKKEAEKKDNTISKHRGELENST